MSKITIKEIKKAVAEECGVSVADLEGKDKRRQFSIPRQVAYFLSYKHSGKSLPVIGEQFGGKDHTTIIFGCRSVMNDMAKKEIAGRVEGILLPEFRHEADQAVVFRTSRKNGQNVK